MTIVVYVLLNISIAVCFNSTLSTLKLARRLLPCSLACRLVRSRLSSMAVNSKEILGRPIFLVWRLSMRIRMRIRTRKITLMLVKERVEEEVVAV